jgi:hypothetical protein
MKNLLAYIILFVYLTQPLKVAEIYINFKINQDYITRALCINIDKPELKCNGQCHLKKELNKNSQNKEETPETIQLKKTTEIATSTDNQHYRQLNTLKNKFRLLNTTVTINGTPSDIFHPPQFA